MKLWCSSYLLTLELRLLRRYTERVSEPECMRKCLCPNSLGMFQRMSEPYANISVDACVQTLSNESLSASKLFRIRAYARVRTVPEYIRVFACPLIRGPIRIHRAQTY